MKSIRELLTKTCEIPPDIFKNKWEKFQRMGWLYYTSCRGKIDKILIMNIISLIPISRQGFKKPRPHLFIQQEK